MPLDLIEKLEKSLSKILNDRSITKIDFAKKIGTTRQNLDRMFKDRDIKLSYIERICEELQLPISALFEESPMDIEHYQPKSKFDELKDKYISVLEGRVKELEEEREKYKGLKNSNPLPESELGKQQK